MYTMLFDIHVFISKEYEKNTNGLFHFREEKNHCFIIFKSLVLSEDRLR